MKGYYFGTAGIAQGFTPVPIYYLNTDGKRTAHPVLDSIFNDVSEIEAFGRLAPRRKPKHLQFRTYISYRRAADKPAAYHILVLGFDCGANKFRDMSPTGYELGVVYSELTRYFIGRMLWQRVTDCDATSDHC